ncbi:phosphatase PAP2 family protein [Sphingomonas alba]|uniref:Phosphatase PAP2 family protein n=1 Tax=Sphingomonas alba TaxID=2908208 RepID=A0ABT0RN48_9SPHN|nr:phosphatase PAP2 family protein [Sphingomonas alba]MCL6684053.1 phosphatase PAP2 family protein [Sphingomonas alba]
MRLPRLRTDGRILTAFLALALLLFLFLRLAWEMSEGETLPIDKTLMLALRASDPSVPVGPPWLSNIMLQLTALGGAPVLWLVTLLATGYLLAARRAKTAGFLFASIALGMALNGILKDLFARPRPELVAHLVQVQTTSFPSGHAMNSAIVYLTLGGLLARAEKRHSVRIFLLAAAIALTMIVGFSRVYLGVHWPSDVAAGWCVGAAWALGCSLAARALQRRQAIDPPGKGP